MWALETQDPSEAQLLPGVAVWLGWFKTVENAILGRVQVQSVQTGYFDSLLYIKSEKPLRSTEGPLYCLSTWLS